MQQCGLGAAPAASGLLAYKKTLAVASTAHCSALRACSLLATRSVAQTWRSEQSGRAVGRLWAPLKAARGMRRVMALLAAVRALQPARAARGGPGRASTPRRWRARRWTRSCSSAASAASFGSARSTTASMGSTTTPARLRAQEEHQGPVVARLRARARGRARPGLEHHREPRRLAASGHVDGFSDPMCDDKETKKRYRADQLFVGDVVDDATGITPRGSFVWGGGGVARAAATPRSLAAQATSWAPSRCSSRGRRAGPRQGGEEALRGARRPVAFRSVAECSEAEMARVPPPGAPDRPGGLTPPRRSTSCSRRASAPRPTPRRRPTCARRRRRASS